METRRLLTPPSCDALWDHYYLVKLPYLQTRSVEHIRRFGIRISEVEELDRQRNQEEILTQLNIDALFEHWRKGATIKVVNYNDTAEIYKTIHSHLVAWAEYLSTGINTGGAPLKDLLELDEFASVVYDKAVNVFTSAQRKSAIADNYQNVQAINFFNVLQRDTKQSDLSFQQTAPGVEVVRIDNETGKPKLPERPSLKDLFNKEINALNGWRNHD